MLKGILSSIELSLKLIEYKIQIDPYNIVYRTIQKALHQEKMGNIKEARRSYKDCPDDEFAKSRLEALSPLKLEKISNDELSTPCDDKPKLIRLMTTDEACLFKAIKEMRDINQVITRDKLISTTQFSKSKVFKLMQSLKVKGYIAKLDTRYNRLEIMHTPIQINGATGILQNPIKPDDEGLVSPKTLIFSLENRALRKHIESDEKAKDAVTVDISALNKISI